MATSSTVILLIVAGSFLGAAYGGDKLHVPPAQDISSFTFQLRTIYGNTTLSNKTLDNGVNGDGEGPEIMTELPPADDNLNIYALPVGQGDCTVIQCPIADGGKITIIDAGSTKETGFTQDRLIRFLRLRQRGANSVTIKSIFLTHPDQDHINYIDAILNAYKDNHNDNVPVYHSCDWGTYTQKNKTTKEIVHLIKSENAKPKVRIPHCCGANCTELYRDITLHHLCARSGVTLKVIGSEYTGKKCGKKTKNGNSIVSIIEYKKRKTLITGDFEGGKKFVNNFINCAGDLLRADIYRLSHHGAANGNANRTAFLRAINAGYVFSSSGLDERYGHPRCKLYDYYIDKVVDTNESHHYTCFKDRTNTRPTYSDIKKAIYVTTVKQRGAPVNYVIHFSITETGDIIPRACRT